MLRCSNCRSILHEMARALVIVILFAVAGGSLAVAPARAARSSEDVLVDANADGDTPISGGLVQVYRCARPTSRRGVVAGASLRRASGVRAKRTNSAGVALVNFGRLPSCLIVDVSGGRANGRKLRGSFRAEAHNTPGQIMSVLVTPVSTLTYDERREHPGMSTARATRVIQRLLGIPSNFDNIDLAADDTSFDGDRYIAAGFRAGSIGKLNAGLIRAAQHNRRHTFHVKGASPAHAASIGGWWKDTDVSELLQGGFKDFGLSILKAGGQWVLGRLLEAWGLKEAVDDLLKPDTEKIIDMIKDLTIRVNNLQRTSDAILKEVAGVNYEVTLAPALKLINSVDTIQQSIVDLVKLNPADPGRTGATKRILDEIHKLEPDRNLLNTLLSTTAGGDGILKAASKKAALRDRWFTPQDSQDVRMSIILCHLSTSPANLMVEYWNTRSCTSTPVPQDCLVADDDPGRPRQVPSRHPAAKRPTEATPTRRTFIDRSTMRMWPLASWPLNGQDALNWHGILATADLHGGWPQSELQRLGRLPIHPAVQDHGLTLPVFGPWTDWKIPTASDYKGLIDGWEGESPLAWLNEHVGFRTTTMSKENDQKRLSGHMWLSDSFRPGFPSLGIYRLYADRANLERTGQTRPTRLGYTRAYMPLGRAAQKSLGSTPDLHGATVADRFQRTKERLHGTDAPVAAGDTRRLLVAVKARSPRGPRRTPCRAAVRPLQPGGHSDLRTESVTSPGTDSRAGLI